MAKDPTEVIRKAVMRMLPRNRLRDVSETSFLFVSRAGHRFIPFSVWKLDTSLFCATCILGNLDLLYAYLR
jgi:hypothetical protein